MANRIGEMGLLVSTQKTPTANLNETGLMVLHDARVPSAEARLREMGLMVLFMAPPPDLSSRDTVQGERVRRLEMIQGRRFARKRGQM